MSFVPMEDLGIDCKYLNVIQEKPLDAVASGYTYFADGDVLLAKITPCFENGKLGIARGLRNGVGFGSTEFIVLRPRDTVDAEYLYYYMSRPDFRAEGAARMGGAVGQQRVSKEFVESYSIPLPPLPEQRRIVAILDEAFADIAVAKANAESNLRRARALFESYLHAVFVERGDGWAEKPLIQLCDPNRGVTYGVIKLGEDTPGGVPCLRTSNVRWLDIDLDGMKRITPALSQAFSRTILRGGEVLVNVRGTLGGVAVTRPEMAGWNISREVAMVPIVPSLASPTFVAYWIAAGGSQQWLGGVRKGAAYVGINLEDLRQLPVRLPKLAEQEEVVQRLDAVRAESQRLEVFSRQKVTALEALKKSLLCQAFTGQLTSRAA